MSFGQYGGVGKHVGVCLFVCTGAFVFALASLCVSVCTCLCLVVCLSVSVFVSASVFVFVSVPWFALYVCGLCLCLRRPRCSAGTGLFARAAGVAAGVGAIVLIRGKKIWAVQLVASRL